LKDNTNLCSLANIDVLMLNDSMRSVIIDGSRIEHLFKSCTNIAAPTSYFMSYYKNYTKWFGDLPLYPIKVVPQFKKLKTISAVLSKSDAEKSTRLLGVSEDVIKARWWCYLSHA
jgi:hypothetical protein